MNGPLILFLLFLVVLLVWKYRASMLSRLAQKQKKSEGNGDNKPPPKKKWFKPVPAMITIFVVAIAGVVGWIAYVEYTTPKIPSKEHGVWRVVVGPDGNLPRFCIPRNSTFEVDMEDYSSRVSYLFRRDNGKIQLVIDEPGNEEWTNFGTFTCVESIKANRPNTALWITIERRRS